MTLKQYLRIFDLGIPMKPNLQQEIAGSMHQPAQPSKLDLPEDWMPCRGSTITCGLDGGILRFIIGSGIAC